MDEWDREFLLSRPQKKRPKYEPGLPDISSYNTQGFEDFVSSTRRFGKRVRLDLGDPYLLLDETQSERPTKRPKLEEKLKQRRPDLLDRILVSRSARDMDEQVVVWKGASVFAKLPANDSWITPFEFERLGPRTLYHKVLWAW